MPDKTEDVTVSGAELTHSTITMGKSRQARVVDPPPRLTGHAEFQTALMHRPQTDWPGLVELEVMAFRQTADGVTPADISALRAYLTEHTGRLAAWKRGEAP